MLHAGEDNAQHWPQRVVGAFGRRELQLFRVAPAVEVPGDQDCQQRQHGGGGGHDGIEFPFVDKLQGVLQPLGKAVEAGQVQPTAQHG